MSVALLRTVVELLNRHDIPHMLASSFASNEYGQLRATQDIDTVIDPTEPALRGFLSDLDRDRFYVDIDDAVASLRRRGMFNVIDLALGWKVDLMIKKDRPFSSVEFERRRGTEAFGFDVWIAAPEDVVLSMLERAGRGGSDRHVADATAVLRVTGPLLDQGYLDQWADELGVAALLAQARADAASS